MTFSMRKQTCVPAKLIKIKMESSAKRKVTAMVSSVWMKGNVHSFLHAKKKMRKFWFLLGRGEACGRYSILWSNATKSHEFERNEICDTHTILEKSNQSVSVNWVCIRNANDCYRCSFRTAIWMFWLSVIMRFPSFFFFSSLFWWVADWHWHTAADSPILLHFVSVNHALRSFQYMWNNGPNQRSHIQCWCCG